MATLYEYFGSQGGTWQGEDSVFVGEDDVPENWIYGDVTESLENEAIGGNDTLTGGASSTNRVVGDAFLLRDTAVAGSDVITGGAYGPVNYLYGDAYALLDWAVAGDDTITGGVTTAAHPADLYAYGDAVSYESLSPAGNDTLIGSDFGRNFLYGDAVYAGATSPLGDDYLVGGNQDSQNYLYGDAFGVYTAHCGDDTLVAGSAPTNFLYGDARESTGYGAFGATGGNDLLISGPGVNNQLFGDLHYAYGVFQGGDDTLVGGTGGDNFWGDWFSGSAEAVGGRDVFVLGMHSGRDWINDFEPGKDLIDISALHLFTPPGRVPIMKLPAKAVAALRDAPASKVGFEVLDSNENGVLDDADAYVSVVLDHTVIDLGAATGGIGGIDTLTVVGSMTLTASDFI